MWSFGKKQQTQYSSDGSSTGSKGNPLLDGSIDSGSSGSNSGFIIHSHDGRRRFGTRNRGGKKCCQGCCECISGCFSSICSCLVHIVILFLPIVACAITLAFLTLLVMFDQSELQETEIYGGEDYQELAQIYYASVSSDTMSLVMSQYEPYREVLALSSTSCILITMVTVARNIQIEVYQKRVGSYVFMKFINFLAALINILAYAGLMVAVNFKVTAEDPEYAVTAHFIGFLAFFAGTAAYSVLHSFLLWRQTEYPTFIKIFFYLLAIIQVGASLAFGIPIWIGGLESDSNADPVYEWVAVFASAISIGFYVILFFVDPVDDELGAFFCGGNDKKVQQTKDRRARQRRAMREHATYSV
mmetsp:Transcript_4029/g.9600  ORF Transcript_4029/g.9600 Transcript_4029/m.9600 type:complete len:358 (-) Transcript_4029:169-1242(-)|eukprot:CAMPEP_0116086252 /NCGR_PEP_ID=MMETSP0327-20121206/4756_1 /TAXON_ID=44447 /ORGANISM="Pseudo-nitzschia delicatissima, Strain B596" /LENGTH=357 /DNA_ID=CAMNT_0003577291 /DNA_START=48 /DNA_END=1121 /DNA_ORIENTATION=-